MTTHWVTALSVHHALDTLSRCGVDLPESGPLRSTPRQFGARIELTVWLSLLARAAQTLGDPLFAWRAGLAGAQEEASPVSVLVGTASSGREAMEINARYFACVTNAYAWEIETLANGDAVMSICGAPEWATDAVAYDLADAVGETNRLTHTRGNVAVTWRGPQQAPDGVYRGLLGVVPTFDAPRSSIVIPAMLLDAPMPAARPGVRRFVEPELNALLASALGTQTMSQRVAAVLRSCARPAAISAEQAARALDLGRRTLERGLAAESTTFVALRDARCAELACRWLPTKAVKAIADDLGYGSVRAFNRAFGRWKGVSPGRWRAAPAEPSARPDASGSAAGDSDSGNRSPRPESP